MKTGCYPTKDTAGAQAPHAPFCRLIDLLLLVHEPVLDAGHLLVTLYHLCIVVRRPVPRHTRRLKPADGLTGGSHRLQGQEQTGEPASYEDKKGWASAHTCTQHTHGGETHGTPAYTQNLLGRVINRNWNADFAHRFQSPLGSGRAVMLKQ